MSKYLNKYRSESHRLRHWDYSKPSIYFITICTQERMYLFGEINNGILLLNENGIILENEIHKSIEIRKNMIFHNCVIMPNHIHFLIEIINVENVDVYTDTNKNITNNTNTHSSAYQRRMPKSISSFIAIFKSITTKQINDLRNTPNEKIWQNNYHDHIVRNEKSFKDIFNYIENNPLNWENDSFR
ncbi:MAG: transposase [Chitinophagales bacterium]|nr:transposase [Chitinophagales bacterium]